MKRVGSQLCFCSPTVILRRMAVEQNKKNTVTRIFSLDDGIVESANTLFFDGILSAEIISLKQSVSHDTIDELIGNFHYLDISKGLPTQEICPDSKPLLLDFGTNSPQQINQQLTLITSSLAAFSIYEIIAACTFYPALALNIPAELCENRNTQLLLWENVDLLNKKITQRTRIVKIK